MLILLLCFAFLDILRGFWHFFASALVPMKNVVMCISRAAVLVCKHKIMKIFRCDHFEWQNQCSFEIAEKNSVNVLFVLWRHLFFSVGGYNLQNEYITLG